MVSLLNEDEFLQIEEHVGVVGPTSPICWCGFGRQSILLCLESDKFFPKSQFAGHRLAGECGEIHAADTRFGRGGGIGEELFGPQFGLLADEGVVHQNQGLGWDVADVAAADGAEGDGGVEGEHHGGEKIAADGDVDAPPAVAIERTAVGTAALVPKLSADTANCRSK